MKFNGRKIIIIEHKEDGCSKGIILERYKKYVKGLHQKKKIEEDMKDIENLPESNYLIDTRRGWEDVKNTEGKRIQYIRGFYVPVFVSKVNLW